MNRPKDDSDNTTTLARLSIRQEQARNREAASLACANAKAQEREALNIFARLPLAQKMAALGLAKNAPARPMIRQANPAVVTLARAIRQARKGGFSKGQENTEKTKKE